MALFTRTNNKDARGPVDTAPVVVVAQPVGKIADARRALAAAEAEYIMANDALGALHRDIRDTEQAAEILTMQARADDAGALAAKVALLAALRKQHAARVPGLEAMARNIAAMREGVQLLEAEAQRARGRLADARAGVHEAEARAAQAQSSSDNAHWQVSAAEAELVELTGAGE